MHRFTPLSALLLALGLSTAVQAQTMSAADARAAKDRIEAEYKAADDTCKSLAGNAKDICVAEAKGRRKVAEAELEYTRSGKPGDMEKWNLARADAAYDVAKEKCDDRAGNVKDVCVQEAKAAHTKAKADAKAGKKTADARQDAAEDKREADWKVAKERCDALSGDPKTACLDAAKARFGKS